LGGVNNHSYVAPRTKKKESKSPATSWKDLIINKYRRGGQKEKKFGWEKVTRNFEGGRATRKKIGEPPVEKFKEKKKTQPKKEAPPRSITNCQLETNNGKKRHHDMSTRGLPLESGQGAEKGFKKKREKTTSSFFA